MTVSYADEAGNPVDVTKLTQGSDLVATITVKNQTALAIDTPRSNLYKKMEQYEIRRRDPALPASADE